MNKKFFKLLNILLLSSLVLLVTWCAENEPLAPDSAAAATLIEALNRFYDMEIDTTDLKEGKDRINSEFSELSQKYVQHREEISGMYM